MRPCMQCLWVYTINRENSVLVLLLVHRGVVTTDRKWRCKQIYSYLEGLYSIFSKNFRKFSVNKNFSEISGLTTLAVTVSVWVSVNCALQVADKSDSGAEAWQEASHLFAVVYRKQLANRRRPSLHRQLHNWTLSSTYVHLSSIYASAGQWTCLLRRKAGGDWSDNRDIRKS